MENTTNLNLKKPGAEDYYNINDFNENMDIIDEAINLNQKDIKNIVKIGVVGATNGIINENKLYDFTHCSQLVSSGNNFTGRVSTNSSTQYIQKGYLNAQNNSFEFKFLVNRNTSGDVYICDTGNIIFSISNTEIKADMYLNGSSTSTSLIITGTFTTDTDYWIKLNFNGTNTYTLGYSTNGTTYTNNTLTNSYKLNPTNLKILFGGWYGATRDTITPYFDGIYDFSETSLIIGGSYVLESNNGNLAETGQNLEILFPNGLNTDKTLKSLIAKRETTSVISNINTSENSFYVLAQYISATDLEVIILKKDLISFQTNEDTLDRSIKTETYYNYNKNTNQWKVKFDGSKYWVNLENTSFILLGECATDYRGVITKYNFYYKYNSSDRLMTSRDFENIPELDKNNNFSGNNNFENAEITAKTQPTPNNSKKVATTEFVNNFVSQNLIVKEFLSASVLSAPNGVITLGADEESVDIQAGLKLLVPNGKNTDGTNKHIIYTVPSIINSGSYVVVGIGLGVFFDISNGTVIKKRYLGKFLVAPDVEGSASYYNITENKYYTSGYDDGVWTETPNIIYLGSLYHNLPEVYIPEHFYGYILADVVPVMKIITNQDLLDLAFPVNTIIEGCSVNPGLLVGGIWAEYGQGLVTVGEDVSQAEFSGVGQIGGEKTHTLTVNQIPPAKVFWSGTSGEVLTKDGTLLAESTGNYARGLGSWLSGGAPTVRTEGGGASHNNLQPYIVVKRWKRTA